AAPVARLRLGLRLLRRLLLLGRVEEDRRSVLVAEVPALPVALRRVVLREEDLEQLVVRDLLRVEGHLDRLGVAGPVRADLPVRRVLGVAAGVADSRGRDARKPPERGLDAPEAAGCECCLLHLFLLLFSHDYSRAEERFVT